MGGYVMAQYTQKAIIETFEKMLIEMPFDKITVSALVRRCEISSNTFYYHYSDIYDLLDVWLRGELIPRGKKVTYEMQEIYPGIYTAGVFLFPDEMVQISVRCGDGDEEKEVKEVLLDPTSCYCREGSIYGEIQKLIELERKENYDQWKAECAKAIRNREAAKELYVLL